MPPRLFSILRLTGNSTELRVNVFLPPYGNPAPAVCFVAEDAIRAATKTRSVAAFFRIFRGRFLRSPPMRFFSRFQRIPAGC